MPPGPCCCEQLGGGWPRLCPPLPRGGPRRPLGVCACAVRSLPPSLEARTFSSARHLNMPEPPSSARCPDPLTLSLGCTPQIFSGRPSEPLTLPFPPHVSPRRPSEPLKLGLQTSPGRLLQMLVVQPVTFEGDPPIPSKWLCPFRALPTANDAI